MSRDLNGGCHVIQNDGGLVTCMADMNVKEISNNELETYFAEIFDFILFLKSNLNMKVHCNYLKGIPYSVVFCSTICILISISLVCTGAYISATFLYEYSVCE